MDGIGARVSASNTLDILMGVHEGFSPKNPIPGVTHHAFSQIPKHSVAKQIAKQIIGANMPTYLNMSMRDIMEMHPADYFVLHDLCYEKYVNELRQLVTDPDDLEDA